MKAIDIAYLNGSDLKEFNLSNNEISEAVEAVLIGQVSIDVLIEPRIHLVPKENFNVLIGLRELST